MRYLFLDQFKQLETLFFQPRHTQHTFSLWRGGTRLFDGALPFLTSLRGLNFCSVTGRAGFGGPNLSLLLQVHTSFQSLVPVKVSCLSLAFEWVSSQIPVSANVPPWTNPVATCRSRGLGTFEPDRSGKRLGGAASECLQLIKDLLDDQIMADCKTMLQTFPCTWSSQKRKDGWCKATGTKKPPFKL
ncbi:uncharacterized protein LOC109284041 isoform X2 [Alligator mississippiensis]|uniref:uncharacterized protein LOC109284041 isoform X2 n=1 Tax=Alligator mississippiensis TaxID=8496 RepID=UPI002877831F|nr:uncharacterized protein LOC109284041 isoform X2 [Alligator mississippiensis]